MSEQRVRRQPFGLAILSQKGADICGECGLQRAFSQYHIILLPSQVGRGMVNQEGFGEVLLSRCNRLDHRLGLGLDVVRLIDHVRDGKVLAAIPLGQDDLMEDPEELIRIDAAHGEVIVGVLAVVEVKAAQEVLVDEERDDVLDVGTGEVVPGVDQDFGLGPGRPCKGRGHSPVCNVSVIERRFEWLVLDQHGGAGRKRCVSLLERLSHPSLAIADMALSGIIGAVGKPKRQEVGLDPLADVHRVKQVLKCASTHAGVTVGDGAQLVDLILEQVGVDGANVEVVLLGQRSDVLWGCARGEVPENVEGNRGGSAGELVDLGRVGELLLDGGSRRILEELAKAGARVGVPPGRGFNVKAGEAVMKIAVGDAGREVHEVSVQRLTLDLGAMSSGNDSERREALVLLSHELGREDRGLAILGEGNASTRCADGLLIKASGRNLGALTREGVVACRSAGLMGLMDSAEAPDGRVEEALLASRIDPAAPKPSVEAIFHAYLLSLPGVEWVGHVHPISVNGILCSKRAAEFAQRRVFPDEVVCCGAESVFVPYVDPGLKLAVVIRREVEAFMQRRREQPRVIVLANHGVITLGGTANAVLGAMLMVSKAAAIWHGAVAMGGPTFLSEADVARIAGRADEHYRQRALNL